MVARIISFTTLPLIARPLSYKARKRRNVGEAPLPSKVHTRWVGGVSLSQSAPDGWISRERAEAIYGVVLDSSGAVDGQETDAARERLASSRGTVTAR